LILRTRLNDLFVQENEYDEFMSDKGKLEIQLVGIAESTGHFELMNHVEAEFGIRKYIKKEANIGNVKIEIYLKKKKKKKFKKKIV